MGLYEDNKARIDREMKARRKALDELTPLKQTIGMTRYYLHTPDRFIWALEDYQRWLTEGLEEWENTQVVKKLKGETNE